MKRLIFILFGLWIMAFGLWGQETIVVGEVYDANTGEPLPNVNIYLQGTQVGTSTNAEGLFLLREDLDRSRTMVVSAVGYHTERFKIEPHTQSGIVLQRLPHFLDMQCTAGEQSVRSDIRFTTYSSSFTM